VLPENSKRTLLVRKPAKVTNYKSLLAVVPSVSSQVTDVRVLQL
jgi:hypothetical protein